MNASVVNAVRGTMTSLRRPTASRRLSPSFLIIGAQKAGTTSLYEHLCEHPAMASSSLKEVHYFDLGYRRGPSWYRAHFRLAGTSGKITGEASPYYLFHPLAPARIAADLPTVKLIVLLRRPVDRTYSHYNHERALGFESLGFEEALAVEAERLAGEEERIIADPDYDSFAHQHHSYFARSCYVEQLDRWFDRFDRDRILILTAEELFTNPRETVATAQAFLGLEPIPLQDATPRNARSYDSIPDAVHQDLERRFAPHDERLRELLERDLAAWR